MSPLIAIAAVAAIQGQAPPARPPGTERTDLQRHDLSIPGWESLQARVDFAPGASFPMHSHPGEEIIYVLNGTIEYDVEGEGAFTVKAGDVLFVPAGVFHSARNSSEAPASELATYVIEKGKPLVTLKR
ncbi:cupin domain-containing protein [Sphingomonas daechungensis]|uniref:Cupin domain-containing protein n=1 Tax=Sphingomonas daechungensis TaxID=1176646 RepID=A0ABX6SYN5_9SPHN|nr:cupin domain-containing protein [Sphingomonas daechungensis]QNP42694.1 cupin domain-containing protein [Sphingomonas daechungensis]